MKNQNSSLKFPLLKGWPQAVNSAMLHVIALAQYAMAYTRVGQLIAPSPE